MNKKQKVFILFPTTISFLLLISALVVMDTDVALGRILMMIAWIILAGLVINLLFQIISQRKRSNDELSLKLQRAFDKGYYQGVRGTVEKLVLESKALDLVQTLLYRYDNNPREIDTKSIKVFHVLLEDLQHIFKLRAIPVGTTVRYDPKIHQAWERIRPGEEAVVVETGWILASDVIKKPVIRREKR